MNIVEVDSKEFQRLLPKSYNVFGTADFSELNRFKCQSVNYLLFKDSKYRLGLIGGVKNNVFLTPFSAPYGGFSYFSESVRIQHIEEALRKLEEWAADNNISTLKFILPPDFYGTSFIAKQTNCLYRFGYKNVGNDLNYFFDLNKLHDNYADTLWDNARCNLRISKDALLKFEKCTTIERQQLAYDIIRRNKEARGFPLHLSWEQVQDTARIIPADYFLVRDRDDIPIASAIVFHTSANIAQIIYWGDLREFGLLKPMNFLSYSIFDHYKSRGFKIVDLGPSTENSVPNYGLCEFKESIGCDIASKLSFSKHIASSTAHSPDNDSR